MYTLKPVSHAFAPRPSRQSSRIRPIRITQFWILLIESKPTRARQAVHFLNQIAHKGTLRGIVPVVLADSPDRALDFLQDHKYMDFRFIIVNGIDHTDDLENEFGMIAEMQELYAFPGEIQLLSRDWTSTFVVKLLDIHTKKRATDLVATS